jgi:uncharacterized membrane protein YoaK (UPF0700 family)
VPQLARALAFETLLVALAAVLALVLDAAPATAAGDVVIGLLAFAMGLRNAVVRGLAVPDLSTTVLTMTITGLAGESRVVGGSGRGTARRVAAIAAMLAGAVAGALLLRSSVALALAAAALMALATWGAFLPAIRRALSASRA